MKSYNQSFIKTICYNVFILGFLLLFMACNNSSSKNKTSNTETGDISKFEDVYWNVKAIHPDGHSLDIKVFNNEGKAFDVKAIQNSNQDNFLDVKAFMDGEKLPVKVLVSKNQFSPVVAITAKGHPHKIKAITLEGEELDIIGVTRFDNVVIMKALTKKGEFYGVKAISPSGQLNNVKGIKINTKEREMSLKGLDIYAHVIVMHQTDNEDNLIIPKKNIAKNIKENSFERIIWNIKAVTPEGKNLDVKAFDSEGNKFDVKATQDSKQHSFMNIKAFVDGGELPVKIMHSKDEYAPIKAIGSDGTIYDIKAVTDANVKLDVKGISRSGNLINVKAVNENGEFYGVKAFNPEGKLNAVKGIKIFDREVEMNVRGNPVHAHLKAITQ
ncbi:DUF7486 family protein [Thalassobellus sediminis]|uniref:DUF7486 family protein n=1 Tax=Thalassobellus sediminis TaxID=3367753 RepID=UPI00379B324B